MSEPMYKTLVLLHVFGAVIFVGNIIVSAMWMARAKRTRDTQVLHFAVGSVIRADWMFTLPGIILLLVPGLLVLGRWGGIPGAAWAEVALALFILSGIVWVGILVPKQRRMQQLTTEAVEMKMALSEQFYKVSSRWFMWGGIATILPVVSLYFMVFKPLLWRQ